MDCQHEKKVLTCRTIRGGSIQYVFQCQECGESLNQPLPHATVLRSHDVRQIPDFDPSIRERFHAARLEQLNKEASGRKIDYQMYLSTKEWADKRDAVLARCGHTCEGCRAAKATQVHHLTYRHIYNEMLFELVGLCRSCHEKIHELDDEARR